MRLFGNEVTAAKVIDAVQERLAIRGLLQARGTEAQVPAAPSPIDPLGFVVEALSRNADASQALPLESHRAGLAGKAVLWGKRAFRTAAQGLINETLGRQIVFNGHVRDGYAHLSAEVVALRAQVAQLQEALAKTTAPQKSVAAPKPEAAKSAPLAKAAVGPKPVTTSTKAKGLRRPQ